MAHQVAASTPALHAGVGMFERGNRMGARDLAQEARRLDERSPLNGVGALFEQPDGWIFLDANSVGPVPKTARQAANALIDDWIALRRRGWHERDWVDMPGMLGDMLAPMIGAGPGEVVVCDSTTINLYKATGHALAVNAGRSVILTQPWNFPTDLHVLQGIVAASNGRLALRYVETQSEALAAFDDNVALASFSHVDYRSSERWDMARINRQAHAAGALTLWDVSHSAGAVPVDAHGTRADYIVGCGYKYLSTGPGGPALIYVRPALADRAWPPLCGWMGHQDIFAFASDFVAHQGIKRFIAGTPAVGANDIAIAAARIHADLDPSEVWAQHRSLSNFLVDALAQECGELGVSLNSPADYDHRGGHLSFKAPGAGRVVEALIEAKVVGSFRKPDSIRFGISPLTIRHVDLLEAVERLRYILTHDVWQEARFANVSV